MSEGGESSGAVGTKEEFSELLSAMKGIQHKMEAMKRDLSDEREAADEHLIKKMQLYKGIHFKRKGNKRQYSFNEEVKDRSGVCSLTRAYPILRMQRHYQSREGCISMQVLVE